MKTKTISMFSKFSKIFLLSLFYFSYFLAVFAPMNQAIACKENFSNLNQDYLDGSYFKKSSTELIQMIQNRDVEAKFHLAMRTIYITDLNLPLTLSKSIDLLKEASEEGHLMSQHYLAFIYKLGIPMMVEPDTSLSDSLFDQTRNAGFAHSKDTNVGLLWLQESSNQGNGLSKYILAQMHKSGREKEIKRSAGVAKLLFDKVLETTSLESILKLEEIYNSRKTYLSKIFPISFDNKVLSSLVKARDEDLQKELPLN